MNKIKYIIASMMLLIMASASLMGCAAVDVQELEDNYKQHLISTGENNIEHLNELSEILNGPTTDQSKEDLTKLVDKMDANAQEIIDYNGIPDKYKEVHEFRVKSAKELLSFTNKLEKGYKQDDDKKISEAFAHLEESAHFTELSNEQLKLINK